MNSHPVHHFPFVGDSGLPNILPQPSLARAMRI